MITRVQFISVENVPKTPGLRFDRGDHGDSTGLKFRNSLSTALNFARFSTKLLQILDIRTGDIDGS
jgi:hypothetical protein